LNLPALEEEVNENEGLIIPAHVLAATTARASAGITYDKTPEYTAIKGPDKTNIHQVHYVY